MTEPNDSAYPTGTIGDSGLTKREAMATKLFAGILANTRHMEVGSMEKQAKAAVMAADDLIKALNEDN